MHSLIQYFIKRPISATVLSLGFVVLGIFGLTRLPLTEYPLVMPPTVQVRAVYPGANPEIISESIAAPLEAELTGLANLQYMTSSSTGDGSYQLTLTFTTDTDPSSAETEIQNRVERVMSRLPGEVQQLGITTEDVAPDILMVVHLVSPDESRNLLYLSNFAQINVCGTNCFQFPA
jgi:multidrug efflux pump subunit AcrB